MKKTFPVNINGKVFYIDEDAYTLLLDYLSQLRATFPGSEGTEIVNDIEQRISEHFDECIAGGTNVIVIDDVNRVIETMGRPEELSGSGSAGGEASDGKTPPNYSGTAAPRGDGAEECPPPIHKRLFRDVRHKVLGGVLAGLAQYLNWDVTVMRILVVILAITPYMHWPIIFIYLISWMVIPVARTPREILEMQGQPVTLDNIGQTVINNSTPPSAPVPGESPSQFANFINTFFSVAATFITGFFGIVSAVVVFVAVCIILALISGIVVYSVSGVESILDGIKMIRTGSMVVEAWGYVCLFMSILIPFLAVARYCAVPLLKMKSPSVASVITAVIFEMLFITATIVLLALANHGGVGSAIAGVLPAAFVAAPVSAA